MSEKDWEPCSIVPTITLIRHIVEVINDHIRDIKEEKRLILWRGNEQENERLIYLNARQQMLERKAKMYLNHLYPKQKDD